MPSKIALLIDAENISHKYLPLILEEAELQGELILKAVYGNWENPPLQKWYEVAAQSNLRIRHQANPSKIKNSSDMKLIMDAMEVLYRVQVDGFCLVTNDADYVPLCDKIHESQKFVVGIGTPHAAEGFIRACDKFIFVGRGDLQEAPPIDRIDPNSPDRIAFRELLIKAFQDEHNWVSLSTLGSVLHELHTNFRPNDYGHATLSKLLEAFPDLVEFKSINGVKVARIKNDTTAKHAKLTGLRKLLADGFARALQNAAHETPWLTISQIGTALRRIDSNFDAKTYGSNLTRLVESMPDFFEVRTEKEITSARLKKM